MSQIAPHRRVAKTAVIKDSATKTNDTARRKFRSLC